MINFKFDHLKLAADNIFNSVDPDVCIEVVAEDGDPGFIYSIYYDWDDECEYAIPTRWVNIEYLNNLDIKW